EVSGILLALSRALLPFGSPLGGEAGGSLAGEHGFADAPGRLFEFVTGPANRIIGRCRGLLRAGGFKRLLIGGQGRRHGGVFRLALGALAPRFGELLSTRHGSRRFTDVLRRGFA